METNPDHQDIKDEGHREVEWAGNRAKLTHENANPAVPLEMVSNTSAYRVENGTLLWAHCITEISIL